MVLEGEGEGGRRRERKRVCRERNPTRIER